MGLYNFKRRFVPFIEDGSKRHTIRAVRRIADKPGNLLHLYTGLRQPGARLIFRAPCVRVEGIRIDRARVWIDGEELSLDEKDMLAWRDGFRGPSSGWISVGKQVEPEPWCVKGCFDQMLGFWVETHGATEFGGQVIHWDYERRSAKESA